MTRPKRIYWNRAKSELTIDVLRTENRKLLELIESLEREVSVLREGLDKAQTVSIETQCDGCGLNMMLIDENAAATEALAEADKIRESRVK